MTDQILVLDLRTTDLEDVLYLRDYLGTHGWRGPAMERDWRRGVAVIYLRPWSKRVTGSPEPIVGAGYEGMELREFLRWALPNAD